MNRGKQILTVCVVVFAMTVCVWTSPVSGGTVARWTFEEGTAGEVAAIPGSILDVAGAHHGTPVNGPVYEAASTPGGGAMGLRYDGVDDRVLVPDDPAFFLTGSLTLEAFIIIESYSHMPHQQIVFRGDDRGSRDPYYLAITVHNGNDGHLTMAVYGNSPSEIRSPEPLPLNELIHVAGTLDDATGVQALYINGVPVASTVTDVRPFAELDSARTPGLGIGSYQSGIAHSDSIFKGIIADVRISDTALTPDQFISELATATLLIDIRGGADVSPVNLKSKGVLPVTVFGSEEIDVSMIDLSTLVLQGAGPRARGKSGKVASFVDMNGDSYLDLNLHFDLEEMDVSPDDTEFTLTGMLNDGTQVEGSDAISIIQLGNAVDEVFLTGVELSDTVIPEPATMSLLVLGGLAMIRKRR